MALKTTGLKKRKKASSVSKMPPRKKLRRPPKHVTGPDWGETISKPAPNDPNFKPVGPKKPRPKKPRPKPYPPISSCFVAGVKVELADGIEKNITEISVGDIVKTQDGNGSVVKVFHSKAGKQKLYGFNDKEPFVTEAHPFMTQDGWKKVSELEVGDTLYRNGLGLDTVDSIESREIPEDTPVYNFHVDKQENYYAGGYLVHNKTYPSPKKPPRKKPGPPPKRPGKPGKPSIGLPGPPRPPGKTPVDAKVPPKKGGGFGGYVKKYPDLASAYKKHKAAGGKSSASAWGKRHYEKHGKKERRKLS
jgi:hypothetical protein